MKRMGGMSVDITLRTPPSPFKYKPARMPLLLERRLGKTATEAMVGLPTLYAETYSHPVLEAAVLAFSEHVPLALRPDDFWLMIAQGVASHIIQNGEALRSKFVQHAGSATLTVIRDGFIKGDPNNDWPNVFGEFSKQIAAHVGDVQEVFTPSFSTTSPVDTACFDIVLMDAMSPYFKYKVETRCGIPSIRLEGVKADWERVVSHTKQLAAIDPQNLGWWTERVLFSLDRIVACFDQPDPTLWESFFKEKSGSGTSKISGWVLDFFPYVNKADDYRSKPTMRTNNYKELEFENFPTGLSSVPFIWKYLGEEFRMKFVAGHFGVTLQDGHLKPVTAWAVQHAE